MFDTKVRIVLAQILRSWFRLIKTSKMLLFFKFSSIVKDTKKFLRSVIFFMNLNTSEI